MAQRRHWTEFHLNKLLFVAVVGLFLLPSLQTLASGAGDCEDFAILKYVALRELGVGVDDLKVVIVQDDKRRTERAILPVRSERKWLVLDNRTMAILNTEDARDYRPLFALNATPALAVAAVDR